MGLWALFALLANLLREGVGTSPFFFCDPQTHDLVAASYFVAGSFSLSLNTFFTLLTLGRMTAAQ